MKKTIQGLMPTTVAGKTTVLIVASLFFVVLALGACARPASVPTPVQVPTPTGEAAAPGGLKGQFEVLDQATPASSTAKPSCCGGSGTVTPISPASPARPTQRGGCCGG